MLEKGDWIFFKNKAVRKKKIYAYKSQQLNHEQVKYKLYHTVE